MAELKVLTTGEAAKYCGVNFRTVIRWIDKGRLSAYKLPGRGDHRIKVDDFLLFLKENEMPIPEDLLETRRSVLVIEDQQEMASAIRRVLLRQGYEVTVAENGFAAGTLLSSVKPALVTLDLKMPGMDGYQVLDYIRNHPDYSKTRVLVVSAENEEGLARAKSLGADDILPKPFSNEDLVAKVEELVAV